jgi:IS5 family transposase
MLRRVLKEVADLSRRRRTRVKGLCEFLQTMADRVSRVVRQTKARISGGLTKSPDKLVSLFEPHTEIIRKGKAFGRERSRARLESWPSARFDNMTPA